MSEITLAMIVKNEANRLPGALAAAAGAVDAVVVVDTGSSDGTVAAARAAGATVLTPAFVSFSDARNAAAAAVQTPWMLVLDAGEHLGPAAVQAIRAAVSAGDLDCGMLPVHSANHHSASVAQVLSGTSRLGAPVWQPRLFRLTDDFCWEGQAYERPRSWLAAPGRVSRDVEADVVRYALPPDEPAARSHAARTLQLLRQRVAADGLDAVGQVALARELLRAGQPEASRAALDAAWEIVSADASQRNELATLATMRAQELLQRDAPQEAMSTLSAVAGWGTIHPNMFLLQSIALENLSAQLPPPNDVLALRNAVEVLDVCRSLKGRRVTEEVIIGATSWALDLRQGVCLLTLGEPERARPILAKAFSAQPDLEEARLAYAESLLESDPAQTRALLSPVLERVGVDGRLLVAASHEVEGNLHEMARQLVTALQSIREGFRGRWRRAMMDELVSMLGILQGDPRPGRGAMGTLAGLMSGYPPKPELSYPAPAGSPLARRLTVVIGYLRAHDESEVLRALQEGPAEGLFPGLQALLRAEQD